MKPKVSIIGAVGLAGTLAKGIYEPYKQSGNDKSLMMDKITRNFTAYNPRTGTYQWGEMAKTYAPAVVGGIVSMVGRKLGLNRMLPKIPYVKLF